jgi:signal transduction histidine kinase
VDVAAHELKTPLTLIDGYTSMLIDVILKQNNNDLLVFTNGILNGSKRLRGIIEDMIDVSLLENNLLILNYQPYWLNRILEFVLLELSPVSKERDISINIPDFEGYNLMNYGDSERLIQLFKNLVINAIKFTPDGGIININGRKLTGFIEVLISDTGIGINQEDQAIIFEKFNRLGNIALHSSSKTKFKGGGPGLGLPIAKGIAEAHGGSIWVESSGYSETDFPGSTFHILLPLLDKLPENN